MKILIINNGTKYFSQLKKLLVNIPFETIKYSKINSVDPNKFDAIILSGGHKFSVQGNENRLQNEINFIRNAKTKIFGICFGFEIIANAFGAKLERMRSKEKGILEIKVLKQEKIFSNLPNFQVFESHRWVVKEAAENLLALARSKDGIEAIKHKTRPIYAVQFHPEMFVDKTCGDEIFYNFLKFAE